jgi:hypothetical protein
MRNLLLSVAVVAGLFLPIGVIHAQSAEVTATCKDGTPFVGTHRSGACRGHGGVQSCGAAPATTGPVKRAAPANDSAAGTHQKRAHHSPRRSGLGQHPQQGLSLPRHSVVRQDRARQLYVGVEGTGAGGVAGPWQSLHRIRVGKFCSCGPSLADDIGLTHSGGDPSNPTRLGGNLWRNFL